MSNLKRLEFYIYFRYCLTRKKETKNVYMSFTYIGYIKLNLEGRFYFVNQYPKNLRSFTLFSVSLNHILSVA